MSRRPRRTSRFAHSEHAVRRAVTGFRRTFPHSGASEPAHDDQVSDFLSTIDPLARKHTPEEPLTQTPPPRNRENYRWRCRIPQLPRERPRFSAGLAGRL